MIRLLGAAALVSLVLTALPAQGAPRKTVLRVSTATGASMKFTRTTLKARAGVVTIVMKNLSILPHDVAIKGNRAHAKGKVVGKGGVSALTTTLKRGRYEFYCTVPGHEAAGMKGTLVVT